MTEPSVSPCKEAAAELIIKLIAFGGGGLVGAVIGGMFISQFARALLGPLPYLWQYCALGLGLLGGLSSYRKAA